MVKRCFEIFFHLASVIAPTHLSFVPLHVEPDLSSQAREAFIVERLLLFKERVVHLPETALRPGPLRRFCGSCRVRVQVIDGKVSVDETQPFGAIQNLLYKRVQLAAVGALVIAVFDQGGGR